MPPSLGIALTLKDGMAVNTHLLPLVLAVRFCIGGLQVLPPLGRDPVAYRYFTIFLTLR